MTAYLDRIDEQNPAVNAIVSLPRSRRAAWPRQTCATRSWTTTCPAAGCTACRRPSRTLPRPKGIRTTSGSRLLADFVPDHDCLMVARMKAAGLHRHRQDQRARVRQRLAHVQRRVRHHPQPVRPDPLGRRQQRRRGGGAGARACCPSPTAATTWARCATRPAGTTSSASGPARAACPAGRRADALPRPDGHRGADGPHGARRGDAAGHAGRATTLECRSRCPADSTSSPPSHAPARPWTTTRRAPASAGWATSTASWRWRTASSTCAPTGCARWRTWAAHVEPADDHHRPRRACGMPGWCCGTFSVTTGLAPLVTDPGKRELVKPEVLWEIDHGLALTATEVSQAIDRRAPRSTPRSSSLFDRFDVLAHSRRRRCGRSTRTSVGRTTSATARWTPTTAGWRSPSSPPSPGCRRSACPVGFDVRGLPMGMQLIGRPRGDVDVLRVAHAYEATVADLGIGQVR